MNSKEINLTSLFKGTNQVDGRLFGPRGTCELCGGAIEIDVGIKSSAIQEAVLEHETTHRADLSATHFGNLYNLVKTAQTYIYNFPFKCRKQIQELSRYFQGNRFAICFEGRATFNERIYLPYISEDVWLDRLKSLDDQTYYEGYVSVSRIMKKFPMEKEILLYLSDTLLTLPLCVEWYESFSTIESASEYARSLRAKDWPSGRLMKLSSSLDEIFKCHVKAIREFCDEVIENFKDVYRKALKKSIDDVTHFHAGFIISSTAPTGTEVSYFMREMIGKYLKEPLLKYGFAYADQGNVTEINNIVRSWNGEIETGKSSIPEFRTVTRMSAQFLNIQFNPIERKRAVDAIRPEKIKDKIQSVLVKRPEAYCIARLHQVWEKEGWQMSQRQILPFGAWYFVLSSRYTDLYGDGIFHVTSPDVAGFVNFSQFYLYFTSTKELIDALPFDVPRTLWLLPSPNAYRYRLQPSLRQDLMRVIEHMEMSIGCDSDWYCLLAENSIGEILRQLESPSPTMCLYNDRSDLWRLWRTEGLRKRVFITPKTQSFHELLRELLESRGIKCKAFVSPLDDYLFQWLGSGEGF